MFKITDEDALERFVYSDEDAERLSWCLAIHAFYRGANKALKTSFESESGNVEALASIFCFGVVLLGQAAIFLDLKVPTVIS